MQEHRYTPTGIEAMLRGIGLEFMGFEFESGVTLAAYRREYPLDRAATALGSWAEFEARHPDAFAGMYPFWVSPAG